jgi:hypothetical protein
MRLMNIVNGAKRASLSAEAALTSRTTPQPSN